MKAGMLNRMRDKPEQSKADPRMLNSRAQRALWFGARMIAGFVWWEMILVRFVGHERVDKNRLDRFIALAKRFRGLAVELGGVWIKLGQFLSSRVDIFPPEIISALADLQDAVPPENTEVIVAQVERELGKPLDEIFAEFEPLPVAAASFGQAHRARFKTADGPLDPNANPVSHVIVKIQRPFMEDIVRVDLRTLRRILRWLNYYGPIRKRANLAALANEFAAVVWEELDYEQEARNAVLFARNFEKDQTVRVPAIYEKFVTRHVLVMENVEAIKITDFPALEQAGVSRAEVAKKMFDTYLQQIFIDGFFHADPHPGNLFVQPLGGPVDGNPAPFKLTYIDFGMMGRVKPEYMRELKEFVISTSLKDARRLTAAAGRMGFFLPGADTLRIEQAIGTLFDKVWGMTTNDLTDVDFNEMYDFAVQFKDLLNTLPFQIPQNVLYLGRAVNILSGMSTALDPAFNPWKEIQPFASDLAGKEGAQTAQDVLAEVLRLGRTVIQLPVQMDQVFSRALNGQLELRSQFSQQSTDEIRKIQGGLSRLTWAIVFAAALGCGTVFVVNAISVGAGVCFALAAVAFAKMVFG